MSKTQFWDGCHKYGWLLTLVGMLLSVAFLIGEMHAGLAEMRTTNETNIKWINQRIDSLERRIDSIREH